MKLTLTAVDSLSRPVTVLAISDGLSSEEVTQAIENAIHQDQGGRVLCWQCTSTVGETSGAGEYRAVDEQGQVWFDDSPIGLLRAELAQAQARITELEAQLARAPRPHVHPNRHTHVLTVELQNSGRKRTPVVGEELPAGNGARSTFLRTC